MRSPNYGEPILKALLSCLPLLAFHPAAFAQDTDFKYNRYKAWGVQAENAIRGDAVHISRADADTENLFFSLAANACQDEGIEERADVKSTGG